MFKIQKNLCAVFGQIAWRLRHRCKGHRAGIWRRSEAKHCSSLCSQSEGDDFLGGLRGLKAQQVASPIISGQARAESPTSPEPRATPWVPCSPSLRPERAKVKNNHSPILLPLQGVGAYTLIPRALPWARNWLPFQGARGDTGGQARAEGPASPEPRATPWVT